MTGVFGPDPEKNQQTRPPRPASSWVRSCLTLRKEKQMDKKTGLWALVWVLSATFGMAQGEEPAPSPCDGCEPVVRAGLAPPQLQNDPNKDGAGDAPKVDGACITANDLTNSRPASASGSWKMEVTAVNTRLCGFAGTCGYPQPGEEPAPGGEPEGEGDGEPEGEGDTEDTTQECSQLTSCKFEVEHPGQGIAKIAIRITSEEPGSGTTGPNPSSNMPQLPDEPVPTYQVEFIEGQPIKPQCGDEIRYVVTWNRSGTRQRWELSLGCSSCSKDETPQ